MKKESGETQKELVRVRENDCARVRERERGRKRKRERECAKMIVRG